MGERIAAGTKVCETSAHVHCTQGGDERSHLQLGNNHTVCPADKDAEQQHKNNNYGNTEINSYSKEFQCQALLNHSSGQHAAQADNGTNGQVNAARNDDEGHAQTENAVQRHMLGDHGKGTGFQKVAFQNSEDDNQKDKNNKCTSLQDGHEEPVVSG